MTFHNHSTATLWTMAPTVSSYRPQNQRRKRNISLFYNASLTHLLVLNLINGCCMISICMASTSKKPSPTSMTSSPPSSQQSDFGPFNTDAISNFIRHRCGSHGSSFSFPCPASISSEATASLHETAVWTYEGSLTDPMTGKVIAEVEGLELVKPLPIITRSSSSFIRNSLSTLDNLAVKNLLFPSSKSITKSPPQWDSAMTVLSRKIFCYRRPSIAEGDATISKGKSSFSPAKSLLTSIRLRPDGPLRHLSPSESIAIYDSAITYVSRNQGREMLVFSERGGGDIVDNGDELEGEDTYDCKQHYFMGSARGNGFETRQSSSVFDFAIHAQRGSFLPSDNAGNLDVNVPVLPPLKLSLNNMHGTKDVVISPPRSRFLQFGKGDGINGSGNSAERKYGSAHETYSYSFGDTVSDDSSNSLKNESNQHQSQCSVRYTRYGEAPPWYAPGRMCTLELRGKRVEPFPSATSENDKTHSSLSTHLSPLALWASSKCSPSFWSGWPTIHESSSSTTREIQSFCRDRQRSIIPFDEEFGMGDNNSLSSLAEKAFSKVQWRLNRLSKSFIVSELPRV